MIIVNKPTMIVSLAAIRLQSPQRNAVHFIGGDDDGDSENDFILSLL